MDSLEEFEEDYVPQKITVKKHRRNARNDSTDNWGVKPPMDFDDESSDDLSGLEGIVLCIID